MKQAETTSDLQRPARTPSDSLPDSSGPAHIVLCGNPNCGKTTLFNALTGLRAKVGNYPGVTVERKEGRLTGSPKGRPVIVLDLPGTYSLSPHSLDEQIARDVLFHRLEEVAPPDLVVVVVDSSNLQRNLYFATQVIELGYPTMLALNMVDVAQQNGHEIDARALSKELGVPVFSMTAHNGQGVDKLKQAILMARAGVHPAPRQFHNLPKAFTLEAEKLATVLENAFPESRYQALSEALLIVIDEKFLNASGVPYPASVRHAVQVARQRLEEAAVDWRSAAIEARYARIAAIQESVTKQTAVAEESFSDKLDRIVTHKGWGILIFVAIMTLMFQSIFSFAELPMNALENGVNWVGGLVGNALPEGPFRSLVVDGVIAGVGAVVVFLPQICLLFFFIGLLEDTGYMARAAFLMDRLMSRVGLHGKSFIPMLSSFACAIPGIMATRTIESSKDRLVTILVAPLMSCSARLPVYTVLIAACIPDKPILGFVRLPGLTMLCMYLLGVMVAMAMAWLFKKTLLKGPTPMLIMELPPYKRPLVRAVLRHMWDRSKLFLRRAGTVILGISILLWFLASYPKSSDMRQQFEEQRALVQASAKGYDAQEIESQLTALDRQEAGDRLRNSLAGRLGRAIEPVIEPLGFDWKIGIGIISSFAAREVFVSTMSQVYNVGDFDDSVESTRTLAEAMQAQKHEDGTPVYTTLVGITLMIFYVFALQCVSTVAVVRRETNSWMWPAFQWLYMGLLAWGFAFLTFQGGRLLGFA